MDSLIAVLRTSSTLKARGLEVTQEVDGTVTIHRAGHLRGLWRMTGPNYTYFPAGSNEALYVARSLDQAVQITEQLFERSTLASS